MYDLQKAGITAAAAYGAAYALKSASIHLDYYSPADFGVWFPFMDKKLLIGIDGLCATVGEKLEVSPAPGAIGRTGTTSQHNLGIDFKVRAVDLLIPPGKNLEQIYNYARNARQFSGIGVYPDWQPRPGIHLDTRQGRTPGDPATWSGLKVSGVQKYFGVNEAFA